MNLHRVYFFFTVTVIVIPCHYHHYSLSLLTFSSSLSSLLPISQELSLLPINSSAHLSRSRYKIVVQTTVGQLRDQGIRVASRCLWDPNTDNYASTSYSNVNDIVILSEEWELLNLIIDNGVIYRRLRRN